MSFVLGHRVLAQADESVAVWAAVEDLPAGATLQPSSVEIAHVRLPAATLARYVSAESDPAGAVLSRALAAGELLGKDAIGEPRPSWSRAILIPVDDGRVASGLQRGDLVDVYATFGGRRPYTVQLLSAAHVVEVASSGASALGGSTVTGITLGVNQREAAQASFALHSAEIDIVRITSPGISDSMEPVTSEDLK